MALSVLVALMMLAVPLASSSNLFVDGGQTNSNGDAPVLGAEADTFDWANSVSGNDLKIIETFIIDSQASYDRLIKYYGFKVNTVGTNSNDWNEGSHWLAVVYYVPNALLDAEKPTVTFENDNLQDGKINTTTSKSVSVSNGKATVTLNDGFYANLTGDSVKNKQALTFELGDGPKDYDNFGLSSDKYKSEYTTVVEAKNKSTGVVYTSEPSTVVYSGVEYTVNFNLNADGKSLDDLNVKIPQAIVGKYSWHKDVDGNIFAVVSSGSVTVQELIGAFLSANNKTSMRVGHTLDAWVSDNGQYDNSAYAAGSNGDLIKENMILSAVWTLNSDEYILIPVNVYTDGTLTGEYTKTYKFDDNDKVVKFDKTSGNTLITPSQIPNMDVNGYVVNLSPSNGGNETIYSSEVTNSAGDKKFEQISITDSLEVKFTMNTTLYSKITVSSVMFDEDVVLYALNSSDYTYKQVFDALKATGNIKVGNVNSDNGSYVTTDKYYKITGWDNGAQLPDSTRNASDNLTLDAELNSYNVVFMVNGKYEVVKVPYGELSADLCTLDVSGLNRWVSVNMENYKSGVFTNKSFTTFNFNSSTSIKNVEDNAKSEGIAAIFVAVFTTQSSTSYAVFDADIASGKDADFGNKDIDKIIISGEDGKNIPLPGVVPSVDAKAILVDWNSSIEKTSKSSNYYTYTELSEGVNTNGTTIYNNFDKTSVLTYTAIWASYDYTITLYSGNDVVGVLYVNKGDISTFETFKNKIRAVQYKGIIYKDADKLNDVLNAKKDGYALKQWNDADGKKMISYDPSITETGKSKFDLTKDFKTIEGDMNLYAKFDANKYTIVYNSAIAAAINEMTQDGYVDDALKLLSEATFSNEGHKLLSWNTRADGLGDSYKLGADFTLTGAQFEDLKDKSGDVTITLYAIWDSTQGSGDNPSGSTGGDDNTNTYLLAGILIVIIILIIVVAVILRKK